MDKSFTVVAGFAAEARHAAGLAEAARQPGFDLVGWQVRNDPTVAAEIVVTIYGFGVRYASGLQGFGILATADRVGTLGKALAFAQEWAAAADNRYVFVRNSNLAKAGEMAEIVAKREAGVARAAQAWREAQASLYGRK